MARDRKRHANDKGTPMASPIAVSDGMGEVPEQTFSASELRIYSCLQTIAILLEKNPAYLPIFLRLEKELEIEQEKRKSIERARRYLPNPPH